MIHLIRASAILAALALSPVCTAQNYDVHGTCEVEVTGANAMEFQAELPAPDGEKAKTSVSNYVWAKAATEALAAKSPQAAKAYEAMLEMPSSVFGLNCADSGALLSIVNGDERIGAEEFAANPGSYALVGSSIRGEQPPGFLTGLTANNSGAFLNLSPAEPGELTITELTDTEFSGEFEFESGESVIRGSFDFERIP